MATPIDISEEGGVRYLHFGSEWVQGAMRIRRPVDLELAYTREMMAGLLLHPPPWPRNALLVGLGAASLARFCYHRLPGCKITVVEIEPRVVAAAQQFFKLPPEDGRFRVVIDDGAHFVLAGGQHYDYILVDGFDRHARVGALDTLPFYQACRARLSDQGLLAVNLFGHSRGFKDSLGRIASAFDNRSLALPASESGNVIALAAAGAPARTSLDELKARAQALKSATGLKLQDTLARLEQARALPDGQLVL
ncbi:MAG: fused MFS/spermidine synthase [Rhodocyclaceae bacterium]|jgi:spermidine synthase|nr:fused MFS/spermidine synthase [Rhodocyclaceae bacterium]